MIKVVVLKTSDDDYEKFVTFETLDDFFKFVDTNHRIIVSKNYLKKRYFDCKYLVKIYDSYVE